MKILFSPVNFFSLRNVLHWSVFLLLTIWGVPFILYDYYVSLLIPVCLALVFIHPMYLLALIVILNPFSDWIVIKFPSLITKEIIDIIIGLFITNVFIRKLLKKERWSSAPFVGWIFILVMFHILSGIVNWTGLGDLIFMNWTHFRFIYMAIAVTQLTIPHGKYTKFINALFVVLLIQIAIGMFQMVGGEWAKGLFYRGSDQVVISYGVLKFESYDTASAFNPGGPTYIYSTFALPIGYGGYLLSMLLLLLGFRISKYKSFREDNSEKMLFVLGTKKYYLIFAVIGILLLVTFNRTSYIGFLVIVFFVLLYTIKSWKKLILLEMVVLGLIILFLNVDIFYERIRYVSNPELGIFDPINRLLSASSYFLSEHPRKIAYTDILKYVVLEKPLFGFGVTSVLNREQLLTEFPAWNMALFYVYGDAGLVRFPVEFGIIGTLFWVFLYLSIFKHARKGYLIANDQKVKAICFAVMCGVIVLIPLSVGSMLILSKSFGLYLWLFIGLSQRWGSKTVISTS